MKEVVSTGLCRGRGRLSEVLCLSDGTFFRFNFSRWHHNDVLTSWADIVGPLLRGSPDGKRWMIGGMYLEFENNGGAAVTPPTVDREEDAIAYYASLSSHPTRDYLRVPLAYSTQEDNEIKFYARSQGVTGVHGKAFSSAQDSRVYGGGLVAFPVFADASQDVVFSRLYFEDPDDQKIKGRGEIMLEWPLTLG